MLPKHMRESICTKLALVAAVLLLPILAQAQGSVVAVTNRTTYNVGSQVMMRLVQAPGASLTGNMIFSATVRYAGDSHDVYTTPASQVWTCPPGSATTSYSLLWKIPADDIGIF